MKIRSVQELRQEELEELRENYFHELLDSGDLEEVGDGKINSPTDIFISNIMAHYEDFYFVDDDFWCNRPIE